MTRKASECFLCKERIRSDQAIWEWEDTEEGLPTLHADCMSWLLEGGAKALAEGKARALIVVSDDAGLQCHW